METKHTPGPWFVGADGKVWRRDPRDLYENGGGVAGDHPIATVHRGRSSWEDGFPVEANARLIAAAPELLDEARAFTAVVVTHECPSCGIAWSENECSQMLDEKSASCLCGYRHNFDGALIAKAEGR